MSVVGVGIDLCSVERWRAMAERRPGVVAKVLTPAEAALGVTSQAGRWAAKEALAKALGAPGGMRWLDCEVVRAESGAPGFQLRGTVRARADELGVSHVHLSISHDAGLATAVVLCEAR